MRRTWRCIFGAFTGVVATAAPAQTTLTGNAFALRSTGSASGTDWTLSSNGYVGTYITLAAPGTVSFSLQASGASSPHMNLVVGDSKTGWDVGSSFGTYSTSISLPAGTHFVRTEFTNDIPAASRTLTVRRLQVSGATVSNVSTNTNALTAANTYIANYRKGAATVSLTGPGGIALLPGTQVNVDLRKHAFNFGTAVAGFNGSTFLNSTTNVNSTPYKFQQALLGNFNAVVPENAGKWASNSSGSTPPAPGTAGNISYFNTILNYAQANHLGARSHNLIWGSQQPTWVNNMLANSASFSTLRNYITDRIKYSVGDATDGNLTDDPALKFTEIDVYNESLHTTEYWNAYGAAGVAGIYNEVASAAASVGANVRLYTNEYNVLADGTDSYANWYTSHIEQIRNAGGNVGGIGVQYYANPSVGTGNGDHYPARIYSTLQNLSVQGLPITLTEFGVKSTATDAHAAQVLSETLPLVFGTPDAAGFFMWGFWRPEMWSGASAAAFYNSDWTTTPAFAAWQALMAQWDTNLNAVVNPDGTISVTGFYGDYNIGGQTGFSNLSLAKGTNGYALQLAAPPDWHFWNTANSGSFTSAGNWTNGVPGGVGHTAHFANAAATRSVTLDTGVVLGMINFDSSGTYTFGGSGSITLDGPGGVTALNVVNGNHAIGVPIVAADTVQVNVATGRTLKLAQVAAPGVTITSGRLALLPGSAPSNLGILDIDADAELDVADVTVHLTNSLADIRTLLADGRVLSSLADASHRPGYRDNSGDVIIQLTLAGDANLDSAVDITDLALLATAWQSSGFWQDGDFNYDGSIDITDLSMLATNWQVSAALSLEAALVQVGLGGIAVPEPAGAISAFGGLLIGSRVVSRNRRRPRQGTGR